MSNFKHSITETFEFFEYIHLICKGDYRILIKLWLIGNKKMQQYLSEYSTKFEFHQNKIELFDIFYNNKYLILNKYFDQFIFQNNENLKQIQALKITNEIKNFIEFDFDSLPSKLVYLSINTTNFTDATLKNLPEKTKLINVEFKNNNNFTNNFGKYLPPYIETLFVENSNLLKFTTNDFIQHLPCNLTKLTLNCDLTEVPDCIENLSSLKSLDLRNNKITIISEKIGNLLHLEYFSCVWNKLREIPAGIGNLSSLKILKLAFNEIVFLPETIGILNNLEYFECHANELIHITCYLKHLTNLKHLKLSTNQLYSFPTLLTLLTKLEFLDISGNIIKTIPDLTNLSKNLQILNLGYNKLTCIPDSIGTLTNLVELSFKYNHITNVSTQIGNLSKLKNLNLSYNELENIPIEIGNLTNLNVLSLHNNNLNSIPQEIGILTNLEILELQENNLLLLPDSMINLKFNLRRLYIHLNPGHYIMKEDYKKKIAEFYKRITIF